MLRLLQERGWNGTAMEFRSAGDKMNRARCLYHCGVSEDMHHVACELAARWPEESLHAAGFSLGGNVLAKCLGERGESTPLRSAAIISTPFDLARSVPALDACVAGYYSRRFLKVMVPRALEKERQYPGCIDAQAVARCRTVSEFDQLVTRPLHGFSSVEEYYETASCARYVSGIRIPTLFISALDDPIIPQDTIPFSAFQQSEHIVAVTPKRGGHLGFVAGFVPWRAYYWAEDSAMNFLNSHAGRV